MMEDINDFGDSLSEDDYYDALIYLLGDAYPHLSEEELEDLLQDKLDRLPVQYTESVLDTIGNIGKKIGSGALQFSADNPDLVKAAAVAGGGMIGGPIGGQIGSGVGSYLSQSQQKEFLPQTGKALVVMQNPQAQAAVARASLGVGNGTAPLTLSGNTSLVPVATFLRAVITAAQAALIELDKNNIIPDATLSESIPYAEDIDMQAEWLAEQLFNES